MKSKSKNSGKLRIGDDWNAIRIIALSLSNPLKAIAELVENSIDAHAKTITITRGKEHGAHYLGIKDDGDGIPRGEEGLPDPGEQLQCLPPVAPVMQMIAIDATVLIQDYDPSWPHAYSKLATRVESALGSLVVTVEHIGSTAVPGLAAKPIIDLDVVLASSRDLPETIRLLASIGYVHEGNLGITGREAFRSPPGESPHHLYVLATGANGLRRHLAFRDALRASEDLRNKYAELKRVLAQTYKDDGRGYTEAKTAFIVSALTRPIPTSRLA